MDISGHPNSCDEQSWFEFVSTPPICASCKRESRLPTATFCQWSFQRAHLRLEKEPLPKMPLSQVRVPPLCDSMEGARCCAIGLVAYLWCCGSLRGLSVCFVQQCCGSRECSCSRACQLILYSLSIPGNFKSVESEQ